MIPFAGRGILLDVEGTTSSVRYVYDVLFPFAADRVSSYLAEHWGEPDLEAACEQIARDAGAASLRAWSGGEREAAQRAVLAEVRRLIKSDSKATGLKALQGILWKEGFESGALRAHVYPDVPPALEQWRRRGLDVRIFSSGSVQAQKLFFRHTQAGDLLGLLRGHYDTSTGPKRDPDSYRAIAADMNLEADEILFASDVAEELDAARSGGMRTVLLERPGNAPAPPAHGHPVIGSFEEVHIE